MIPGPFPALAMRGIRKRFGATVALDGVDLDLPSGQVLALIGENGAGKSTLMNVLAGVVAPDAGTMHLGGVAYTPADPHDARDHGVAMIHQELTLAGDLDAVENICLGQEPRRWGLFADRSRAEAVAREALGRLGVADLPLTLPVRQLGIAERQLVEIARALASSPRVLVMDEPTSSLSARETQVLFALVRSLAGQGVSIIYISHFLEECRQVADRYLVLRDGATVGQGLLAEISQEALIAQMVGRTVADLYPRSVRQPGEPVLTLTALSGRRLPLAADLCLHRGEVFGIFGLVGAGRSQLLRAVFGLDPVAEGRIAIGRRIDRGASPRRRIGQGLGMVSEDRKAEGLLLRRSIADDLTLGDLAVCGRAGLVLGRRQRRLAETLVARFGIRCRDVRQATGDLSGGNQQKVALARLVHQRSRILLLDEPTRGIDVGSKADIYRQIDQLAVTGVAVVLVSSYLPELMGMCDRIAVMCTGRLGMARPVGEWTQESLLTAAIGKEART